MAYFLILMLTWAQAAASLWTLDGLYSRLDATTAKYLMVASNNTDRDTIATQQLARLTDHYKNRILSKCRNDYPDDIQSVETALLRLKEQANEYSNYAQKVAKTNDAVPPLSGFLMTASAWPPGSSPWTPLDQMYGYGGDVFPRIFFSAPPVTNTLFAGAAETGEFLALVGVASNGSDMPAQRVYINRGTKDAPNWQAFDSDSLIDYLINPDRIQECGYERWKYYICKYAIIGDAGDIEWRLDKIPPFLKAMKTDLLEEEEDAFALIRISLAGTGIASDYERKTATKRKYVF